MVSKARDDLPTAQAGDDHQLVARDVQREVLEVMLAGPADSDEFFAHGLERRPLDNRTVRKATAGARGKAPPVSPAPAALHWCCLGGAPGTAPEPLPCASHNSLRLPNLREWLYASWLPSTPRYLCGAAMVKQRCSDGVSPLCIEQVFEIAWLMATAGGDSSAGRRGRRMGSRRRGMRRRR